MRVPRGPTIVAMLWAGFVAGFLVLSAYGSPLVNPFSSLSFGLLIATGYLLPWPASAALLVTAALVVTLAGPDAVSLSVDLGGGPLPAGVSLLLVGGVLVGLGTVAQLALAAATRAGREEGARRAAERETLHLRLVLGAAAHEIGNNLVPLHAIADHLRDDPGDVRAPEQIERATRSIRRLVGDLSDAARSLEGRLGLRPDQCDLAAIAREVAADFEGHARRKALALSVDAPGALPVFADVGRVEQAVANLLQNAVRYTPEGGAIRLRVAPQDAHATVEVADTGLGLTPEQIAGLFRPFARFHADAASGSGLGLWVVRNIMDAHGGSVVATSPGPGMGATFTLRFPEKMALAMA